MPAVGLAGGWRRHRRPSRAGVTLVAVSIQVRLDDLQRVLADFDAGYLLTVDPSVTPARVKLVSVRPALVNGVLVAARPGRGSVANVRANPAVTLLWPPRQSGGFSLIVDGRAECRGEDVHVTPDGAVLHKPAGPGAG